MSSKLQIYQQSAELYGTMSKSTFYRESKAHAPEYVQSKRRVDVCDICLSFDTHVGPALEAFLRRARAALEALVPTYFEEFDKATHNLAAHEQSCSSMLFLETFHNFLRDWRRKQPFKTMRARLAVPVRASLKDAEDALLHELAGEDGWLDQLRWFSWHWTTRDRQNDAYEAVADNPPEDEIELQMDFKEKVNLPVGPREGGKWWYAGSRMTYQVWTCYVKRRGRKPLYATYVSTVLECTPLFVVAMLEHFLASLRGTGVFDGIKRLHMWCDTGPHFRAYEFLSYWCVYVPKLLKIDAMLSFFAEHHGKGRVDAHFGHLSEWLRLAAAVAVISDAPGLVDAWRKHAAQAYDDSGKTAANCTFVDFTPPAKASLPQDTLNNAALQLRISRSMCWAGVRWKGTDAVRLHNYVFTGAQRSTWVGPVLKATGDDTDWRQAYRKEEPEFEPPPLAKLKKRFLWQKHVAPDGLSTRLRPLGTKVAKFLKSNELQRRRQSARRRRLAEKQKALEDSDSSTSNGSSSSSSDSEV